MYGQFFSLYTALFLSSIFFITKLFLLRSSSNTKNKTLPPSGPRSYPISGHLHLLKKPLHLSLAKLAADHGNILMLRFGTRRVLVVSSSSIAEEIFTKNDAVFADRPHLPSNRHTSYNYTTLAFSNCGPRWRTMRRIASVEALSFQRLVSFTNSRTKEVGFLISSLFREFQLRGDANEKLVKTDLRPKLFGFAYNVIMNMIAGKRIYGVETSGAKETREIIKEHSKLLGVSSSIGDFLPLFRLFDTQGIRKKAARVAAWRDDFMQKLINDHRNGGNNSEKKEKTLIHVLLSFQQQDPITYTDSFIKAFLGGLISAGTDTSSNMIEWAFALLLNHPEYMKQARDEIDSKVGSNRLLTESDLPNLAVLRCIVEEALRLHPASPLLFPHESSEDCTVGGYFIPRGTMLLVNAYVVHRDPSVWEKPTNFMPERFQNRDINAKLLSFGMGRRRCPGEGLAMRELSLTLATLIQCFEWDRVGSELVDMEEGAGLSVPKAKPLEAMYHPRPEMVHVLASMQPSWCMY